MAAKTGNHNKGFTFRNNVTLVRGGADYFERIEAIANAAVYTLHVQTYIFDEDETGMKVAAALKRAAVRGVHVFLLTDGYASRHLSEEFKAGLNNAGVHFAFFKPVFQSDSFYLGRRLHHKVVVADGFFGLVAGLNISNRYNDIGPQKAWLDWALYVEGEASLKLLNVCQHVWERSVFRQKCRVATEISRPASLNECAVRVRRNDWVYKKTEITRMYRDIFREAKVDVTVMTGYFWPPRKLLRDMTRAAERGVTVRIILTGKADVPLSKYTERYLYDRLLRSNIQIFEYEKNILHGKMAVSDGVRVTAGSYNMNNISAFASVELNLEVADKALAALVTKELAQIIENDCEAVTSEDFFTTQHLMKRVFYFLSYQATHVLFFLFTFYFRQRRWEDY